MNFRAFKEKVKEYPLFSSDLLEMISRSPQSLRNQICRWEKKGLITSLRRGLYTLVSGERAVGLSNYFLANNLYSPSYVSLESALSYYHLIPEKITATTSISPQKTKTFTNDLGTFIFRHLKKELFFGFHEEKDEFGFKYFLADPEKALLDYLYLNLGGIKNPDKKYLFASLRLQNTKILDRKKLKQYVVKFMVKKLSELAEAL
jgi:predicted transcriptional regulator of viral defense system